MSTAELEMNSFGDQKQETENVWREREAMSVVAGLIIAATFTAILQPPGGLKDKGKSNLAAPGFYAFAILNTLGFTASMLYIVKQLINNYREQFMIVAATLAIFGTYAAALDAVSSTKWAWCIPLVSWGLLRILEYVGGYYENIWIKLLRSLCLPSK